MEVKQLYQSVLSDLLKIEGDCDFSAKKTRGLLSAVSEMPLLVPVVGEFSAGKSSLLNRFIGKNLLSVNISPETAKPAELYFSEEEYDECVDDEGNASRISSVENLGESCVCVRRHINSPFLKQIEPIVLVDMPGFDSPLDAHNKAIFNYLDKGSHYVVLTPSDAGTVSRSMSNQIQNILSFGKNCSFFISKCDLRSESEIEEVKSALENTLEGIVGERVTVSKISQQDSAAFEHFAKSLDSEKVFKEQFFESVKDELYDAKDAINTKISALKKDRSKNEKTIAELKAAQAKIEAKKAALIANAQGKSYAEEAEKVSNAIGQELSARVDSLADVAIYSGQAALQEEINSIVQTTAVSQMQSVIQNVTVKISGEFSKEIKNLSETLRDYGAGDAIAKIQNVAQDLFTSGKANISAFINSSKSDGKMSATIATALAGVFSVATSIVAPVVEIIIILLPTILNAIFQKAQEQKQKAQVKSAIQSQIPIIKRNVREKVSQVLKENADAMIAKISEKFDEELKAKEAEIQSAMEEMKNDTRIEEKIALYRNSVSAVEGLLDKIL